MRTAAPPKARAKRKPMSDRYTRCAVAIMEGEVDVLAYRDERGNVVALVLPNTGTVADLRIHPPFLSMSPCPYCGALDDKGHAAIKHIDPFLGERITQSHND